LEGFLDPEERGTKFLQNVSNCLPFYTVRYSEDYSKFCFILHCTILKIDYLGI